VKKIIFMVLLILLLFIVSACGGSALDSDKISGTTNDIDTLPEATESVTEARKIAVPDLPDIKFDGYEIKMLARGVESSEVWQVFWNIDTEEETGESLNDALYARNRRIEDKYDITITGISSNTDPSKIASTILSGANEYDVVIPAMYQFGSLITRNLLTDLKEVPYLDLEKPWWDNNLSRDLSLSNKLYGTMGDICISTMNAARIIMFNKQMLADYSLENPYNLVRSGKWTLDKFNDMCRQVTQDINGDGKMDDQDLYGFLVQKTATVNLFFAAGENMTKKDDNDIPYISVANNERAVSVFTKMLDILNSKDSVYVGEDGTVRTIFESGRGLFYAEVLFTVGAMRGVDINFGVLPTPKYDENQENYYHFADAWCMSLLGIPMTNENLERTGIILEALAAESANTIVPAYYDLNLIGKFFRDEESIEMLDLIINTRVVSMDEMFEWGMHAKIRGLLDKLSYDIASTVESSYNSVQKKIDGTLAKIEN
ncbi:MAG: extracellular solute-binding protein, partial [Oscillospiraceae bacterium]|nr:extracellular solute-binding protein [Oscillospiraceae bacterium]